VAPLPYAAGVHTRSFARSFIVESIDTHDSVVFVTCDLGMLDDGLRQEVNNSKTFKNDQAERKQYTN